MTTSNLIPFRNLTFLSNEYSNDLIYTRIKFYATTLLVKYFNIYNDTCTTVRYRSSSSTKTATSSSRASRNS